MLLYIQYLCILFIYILSKVLVVYGKKNIVNDNGLHIATFDTRIIVVDLSLFSVFDVLSVSYRMNITTKLLLRSF